MSTQMRGLHLCSVCSGYRVPSLTERLPPIKLQGNEYIGLSASNFACSHWSLSDGCVAQVQVNQVQPSHHMGVQKKRSELLHVCGGLNSSILTGPQNAG